jgi:capsular exopolysaccharide synthesis family protein
VSLDKEISYTRKSLLENVQNLLGNASAELNNLNRQKEAINAQLASLPKEEQNLIGINRKFELNNELYTFLMQKKAEAGIIRASNFSNVQVLDPANLSTANILGHNKIINLIIGLVSGATAIMLYFLLFNYFDKRIYTLEEVREKTELPIFGAIGHNKLKTVLPVLEFPNSAMTESFRLLRSSIQSAGVNGAKAKVISINSCVAGEGKSFVTVNLAAILAKTNKKVLIIETDLRKPKLFAMLKCTNRIGLTDYLNKEKSFNEVTVRTNIQNLHFISAGPGVDFPSELINNGHLESLIRETRSSFDYILIKCPPSEIISDAAIVLPMADLNLFVVKVMHSTLAQLDYINSRAADNKNLSLGVIVNDIRPAFMGRRDYGYYNEQPNRAL